MFTAEMQTGACPFSWSRPTRNVHRCRGPIWDRSTLTAVGDPCPPRFDLKGLPEPFFELHTVGPADAGSRSILQHCFKFAVRDRLKLENALNIDERRTVDPDKPARVELLGKIIECRTIEQFFPR